MIVTYLRSSSYSAWDWCPHRFYLEYTLGLKFPAGQAADRGNIFHKALELLARKKLAAQQGTKVFRDEETGREFVADGFDPEQAIDYGWWLYTQHKPTTHRWAPADFRDCRKWMYDVLEFNGGQFSPLKRHVLAPEQFFDIEIREPWARYAYDLPDGTRAEGNLSIKGTVDLVTLANPRTVEYIDWKSGARKDWATEKEKTPEKLRDDPQLRMYHYALAKLYPKVPFIVMSIYFVKDGGPFSFCFDRGDLKKTEEMLRRRFDAIRNTDRPRLTRTWKCSKLCPYGKIKQPGTDKLICEHFRDELVSLGMDRVNQKYLRADAFREYGQGGGQSNREGNRAAQEK